MIEASFLTQYGIRLREVDLDWSEFSSLLSGLMPKTPLGQIISIRSEDDKEMLKNFNKYQRKIRSNWRSKQAKLNSIEDNEIMMKELEKMFERVFSKL